MAKLTPVLRVTGSPRLSATWLRTPTSRCYRARRRSAITTATWSARSSASPIICATAPPHAPRQRLWKIRAKAVVLASGAIERPIAYANNDLPGTMLAGAAHTYVKRYGVRPGSRAVIFTNNDGAYAAALALHAAGVAIGAIVDARPASELTGALPAQARAAGLTLLAGSAIVGARGSQRVTAVDVAPIAGGTARRIECDLVCVSGGWNPAVHLFSQARGKLRYDEALATFVPESSPLPITPAGAANGCFDLAQALAEGHAAGVSSSNARRLSPHRRSRAPRATSSASVAAAAAMVGACAQQVRQVFRRSAKRCDRQRHRARRARELSIDRASEALHHARHGHRSGQDQQHDRARADGAAARRADSEGRHDDVSPAVHAGDAGRRSRT